jgi:hypothetical protein
MRYLLPALLIIRRVLAYFFGYGIFRSPSKQRIREALGLLRPVDLPTGVNLIRVGPPCDGGYVIPNCLNSIEKCLSPGVGPSCEFEKNLYEAYGVKSHLLDGSVPLVCGEFVEKHTMTMLSAVTNASQVSFNDWCLQCDMVSGRDYLLQMDIEGSEYESILSLDCKYLRCFRIIVIELHCLDHMASSVFYSVFLSFLRKLLENHRVVHLHPNTSASVEYVNGVPLDRTLELTLLRNDYLSERPAPLSWERYPIADLDFSNVRGVPDRKASKSFFGC